VFNQTLQDANHSSDLYFGRAMLPIINSTRRFTEVSTSALELKMQISHSCF